MKPFQRDDLLEKVLSTLIMDHAHPRDLTYDILFRVINERDKEIAYLKEELAQTESAYSNLSWEKNP